MEYRLRRFLSMLLLAAFTVFSLPAGFLADSSGPDPFAAADAAYRAQVAAAQMRSDETPPTAPPSSVLSSTLASEASFVDMAPAYLAVFSPSASSSSVFAALEGSPYRMLGPSSARTFRVTPADPQTFQTACGALLLSFEPEGRSELASSDFQAIPAPSLPKIASDSSQSSPLAVSVNDPLASQQWALGDMKLFDAWSWTQGSNSVKVAVIDTGVFRSHEDFAGTQILSGWDCVVETTVTGDAFGHGTMTSGVIAATPNNATGIAGVCFDVTIVPYQVFQTVPNSVVPAAFDSNIIQALYLAADSGCNVVNLSLGTPSYSTAVNTAVQYALSKGCIVVAASGNERSSTLMYPASYPGVVSVAAHDSTGTWSEWSETQASTYNSYVDVSAPGTLIEVTNRTGGYVLASGTSFASPYVAGVAALAVALEPTLTSDFFYTALQATSVDKGTAGYDPYYGYGNIDANALLSWVDAGGSVITTPPVSQDLTPFVAYSNQLDNYTLVSGGNTYYYAKSDTAYSFTPTVSGVYNFDSILGESDTGDTDIQIFDTSNSGISVALSDDPNPFHVSASLVQGHVYRFYLAYYFINRSDYDLGIKMALQFLVTPPTLLDSRGVVIPGNLDGLVDTTLSREFFTTPAGAGNKVLLLDPVYNDDPYNIAVNASSFASTTGGCFFLFSLPTGQSSILLDAVNHHADSAYHLILEELATITTDSSNTESLLSADYLTGATFTPSQTGQYRFSTTQTDATIQFCDTEGSGAITNYLSSTCDVTLTAGSRYDFFVFTSGAALSQTLSVRRLSSIATLSALAVSNGSLSPSFSSETISYSLELGSSKSPVTVTPTRTEAASMFYIDGVRVDSAAIDPAPGKTKDVQILVVAEDGVTQTVYTVSVHRPSDQCALIGVEGGTYQSVLSMPAVLAATLPNGTTSLVFEASLDASWELFADSGCVVPVDAASPGLADGMNTFYVKVIAENSVDARIWQVLLNRLPATGAAPLAVLRDNKGRSVASGGTALSDLFLLAFGSGPFTLATTLDGIPVAHDLAAPFTQNGLYSVTVTDSLLAVTMVTFTLAKVYPLVTGVIDGTTYHSSVTVHFDSGEATLDGNAFANDSSVSSLGDHVLLVTNSDGNTTTVRFTIALAEITSTEYNCNPSSGFISLIGPGTTVQTLLAGLDQRGSVEVSSSGIPVPGTSQIGTGMVLKLMDGSTVLQSLTVVVTGDVNGDGRITLTDFVQVKAHLMAKSALAGAYGKAADVNGDGKVTLTDFVKLKSHLMGKVLIVPISY